MKNREAKGQSRKTEVSAGGQGVVPGMPLGVP